MKTKTFLALASLAVFASSAHAAANQTDSSLLVLPTYVVTAPRLQPAELKVRASLQELRAQAALPPVISPELPVLKARTAQAENLAKALRNSAATLVAKS